MAQGPQECSSSMLQTLWPNPNAFNLVYERMEDVLPSALGAQASAVSAMRSLRVLLGKPADLGEKNAQRDVMSGLQSLGYSLPINIHCKENEGSGNTFHIKPQEWIKYLMENCPAQLGGCNASVAENCFAFWKVFQIHHPTHEVFQQHGDRLHQVLPLIIHGDEGRALKRTNYLVVSMESPFGSVNDPTLTCECASALWGRDDLPFRDAVGQNGLLSPEILRTAKSQVTNYKGHSFLSKFILFGVAGWLYKRKPSLVEELLQEVQHGMDDLFWNGARLDSGEVIFAALLGVKGDMEFHKKTFNLSRSYANAGSVSELELCHLCKAGNPAYPFEDFSESPVWQESLFSERPWPNDRIPILAKIPFDTENIGEKMLQNDYFHIFKLGVARDIIGGIVVVLARLKFFDYENSTINLPDKLTRAHGQFSLWARAHSITPGFRSFSMAFYNMKSLSSAPWVNCKGSDAKILLQWLKFFISLNLQVPSVAGHERLLQVMLQVVQASLESYLVHKHALWLSPQCARNLYIVLMRILRGYMVLSSKAMELQIPSFILKPKHHGLHHLAWSLREGLRAKAPLIPNPQLWATEMNEDYMGRVSRLSRKVSTRLCDKRVYERIFLKIVSLLKKQSLNKSKWIKQYRHKRRAQS